MPSLELEIEANFEAFEYNWPLELNRCKTAIDVKKDVFSKSYMRISSIQAWRTSIINHKLDEGSAAFFFEAQNDFLVSHCLARCGSFRQALKAQRAAIENILFSLYYKDHPIELSQWDYGKHKIGFTSLHDYFLNHPFLIGSPIQLTGLDSLKSEYSTLSKAVHGSAKIFRMTDNLNDIRMWSDELDNVGKWATREKAVITSLNYLLLWMFKEELRGTKNSNLRKTLSLIIPKSKHIEIKNKLGISIIKT